MHNAFSTSNLPTLREFEKNLSQKCINIVQPKMRKKRGRKRVNGKKGYENIEGVQKPSSPFFLYVQHIKDQIKEPQDGMSNKEIISAASKLWGDLSTTDKKSWCKKHEQIKQTYMDKKKLIDENKFQDSILTSAFNDQLNISPPQSPTPDIGSLTSISENLLELSCPIIQTPHF